MKTYAYEGNLIKTLKKRGNGTDWLTETFVYDIYGNVKSKQLSGGGANRLEEYKYATTYGGRFLTESTDVEGLSTTYTYDSVTGNILTVMNPYGLKTTFSYDSWDRLETEKDYLNNTTEHIYTPQSGGGMKVATNYPEGAKEETLYNAFGWQTRVGTLSLNGQWVYKSYGYDIKGRQVKVSEPYFGGASQWNEIKFDQYGRVIDQILYTGKNIKIDYTDGTLTSTVNDGTKTITTTVDALGNKVKVEDQGGIVNYAYYPNGVMKTANYDGHEVIVQIDGWGRKIKLTDPAAGAYTYEYDILGQLLKETTPKGATEYTYSSVGKVLTKKITGDHTNMSLTYQYNADKLISSTTGVNNTDTETYTYSYAYDSYKRPYTVKEVNNKASFEKRIHYDGYGRINTETYVSKNLSDGTSSTITTKKVYDSASGLLKEIRDNNNATADALWKINEINARGQVLDIDLGNGIEQTNTFNSYGYLSTVRDVKNVSSGNDITALSLNYTFNTQQGTLTNRKNNKFGWNENFEYDKDRLKTISGSVSKTMTFDNRGRITKNTDIGDYAYESNNVYRLKEITPNTKGASYYEQHPTQQISYNAFKKPVEIIEEGHGRASFEYSPVLTRSHAYYGGTQANKEERRYHKHYSSIIPVEIVEDIQTGSTKIITYIAGDAYSAPIAHIKKTGSGVLNEFHYLHRDYLGSIMAITDASGNIKEQRQFGAWGTVDKYLNSTGATVFTHNSLIERGYTGHEHFFEVGLIHMNGRMYDANLGRFLSPDNFIQDPYNTQNFNRYGYVLNNPLLYNDPSGEFLFTAILVGAIIGAATGAAAYVGHSIKTGDWNWGQFGMSVLGGAIVGAITAGQLPASMSVGYVTSTIAGGFAAGLLPSANINIGNWNIGLSPAIAFGKGISFGANVSLGFNDGNFSASVAFGVSYSGSAIGSGARGWEYRKSWGLNWDDGNSGFGLYSTSFSGYGGSFNQKVGGFSARHGDFGLRYENDFIERPLWKVGKYLADNGDRYRTTALQLSYKDFTAGLKFFTGEPDSAMRDKLSDARARHGIYNNPGANMYRLGAAYVGYKGHQAGYNSEAIRGLIQNRIVHNHMTEDSGWFRELPTVFPSHGYYQYQSYNPYTLW